MIGWMFGEIRCEKNKNASRPSEQLPDRGGKCQNVSNRWDHQCCRVAMIYWLLSAGGVVSEKNIHGIKLKSLGYSSSCTGAPRGRQPGTETSKVPR